jgi:hypothetical protein
LPAEPAIHVSKQQGGMAPALLFLLPTNLMYGGAEMGIFIPNK